jgi:hypothetical protein
MQAMKVQVNFLLTHKSDLFNMARVPCVGEQVCLDLDGEVWEVKDVVHILNPGSLETKRVAIVTVL